MTTTSKAQDLKPGDTISGGKTIAKVEPAGFQMVRVTFTDGEWHIFHANSKVG